MTRGGVLRPRIHPSIQTPGLPPEDAARFWDFALAALIATKKPDGLAAERLTAMLRHAAVLQHAALQRNMLQSAGIDGREMQLTSNPRVVYSKACAREGRAYPESSPGADVAVAGPSPGADVAGLVHRDHRPAAAFGDADEYGCCVMSAAVH